MGSLRNPVGPLPSTIYWRRRVVLLSVFALLALVITWIVTAGGGGGKKSADGSNGKNPTHTITPGPTPSGSAISQHPGGRDESGGTDTGGSGSGSGGDSGSEGATDGSTGSSGSAGSAGGSGAAAGGGAVVAGDALPASSSLPDCASGAVTLGLRSVHNSYSPDEVPTFELTAKNGSSADCKVDLGPRNAVLTITPADGDDAYWSSDDCPEGAGNLVFRVPAGETITYTVKWDRKPSAPQCATPSGGSAKAGTYLLEAKAPGFTKAQASFVLSAD
ncbi:hypothetical protein JK361_21345 [Streptomyces sp. 5-8]|uniref:DUF4232 domain-containing protein n=1 Tax=Streptomyces musisoli TaxID=2802280 RepID=A0ABS1P423_9ACTN|nr:MULTISPECIES: hypothetical protein [Streptomyces]MBL1107119.1 hypothetical protein [Streptomyces musisoli]MBY8842006.1 hypothetical protein [Streptomyces sp. SP2-10]